MSFGRLGSLGAGFGRMGTSGASGEVDPDAPGEPTFAFVNDPDSDSTPAIDVGIVTGQGDPLNTVAGDVLVVEAPVGVEWFTQEIEQEDIDNQTMTVTGATPLSDGSVTGRARITRDAGAHVSDWSSTDSTVIDTTGPVLASSAPADNATDVDRETDIVLVFNENITLGTSGTLTLKKSSDDSTVDSWDVATDEGSGAGQLEVANDDELHLHLSNTLPGATEVYLVWDAGILEDALENASPAQASETLLSFTTEEGAGVMTWVTIPGGMWVPMYNHHPGSIHSGMTLDADEEEAQVIGKIRWVGGPGTSKTFGTSGSKIGWRPGTVTFTDDGASDPTLRVGVKKAASISTSAGPAARATIGTAAFDVYDDLVGGTDTITASTWREDTMSAGTPFTLADGDMIAVCWHLDKPGAGSQSVLVHTAYNTSNNFPAGTLVTSGPTYTASQGVYPNVIFIADDGTIGWLEGGLPVHSSTSSETIGNGNIYGNVFQLPVAARFDAVAVFMDFSAGTRDFDVGFWSDPAGTPTPIASGVYSHDANIQNGGIQIASFALPSFVEVDAATDVLVGVKQTTANGCVIRWFDQANANYFRPYGLGPECYAAKSTGGAAIAQQNSGNRRACVWAKIAQIRVELEV